MSRFDPGNFHATVNNEIYQDLGARWYEADDDPIALLRAESRFRNPWIADVVESTLERVPGKPRRFLDVGCGGGFLANDLSRHGYAVTGIDAAEGALQIARAHDATKRVCYLQGDAYRMPFEDASFDVVCAMDFLEHVEEPARVITEASRVLAPSGMLFFYTFNRTPASWLVAIKGVEWFVRNTPRDLHLHRLFITPAEITAMCENAGLSEIAIRGVRPRLGAAFFRMLRTGRVGPDFAFRFSQSTQVAYVGHARKRLR